MNLQNKSRLLEKEIVEKILARHREWTRTLDAHPDKSVLGVLFNVDDGEFDDPDSNEGIANFENVDLRSVDLQNQDLRMANLRFANLENVDLSYSDLRGADLQGAKLKGANLSEANLSWCKFWDADLSHCDLTGALMYFSLLNSADLRNTNLQFCRSLVLSQTRINGALFNAQAADPWSVLRRKYTGPMFFFHVLFLVAFIAPFVLKALFWSGINRYQEAIAPLIKETELRTFAAANPNILKCGATHCSEESALTLIIGFNNGIITVAILIVLLFNIIRGYLTWRIGPMRDAEERSGVSPEWSSEGEAPVYYSWNWIENSYASKRAYYPERESTLNSTGSKIAVGRFDDVEIGNRIESFMDVFEQFRTIQIIGEKGYRKLYLLHLLASALFFISAALFIWNAWNWLTMPIYVPIN